MRQKFYIGTTLAVAIGLIVLCASNGRTEPVTLLPSTCGSCVHHSGMLAIAALQTARLNALSIRDRTETAPLDLELRFYDGQGTALARSRVSLMPGQSGFLELPHRELGRNGRVPIRAEVVAFNPQPDPPGWVVTLEIYDNLTGRTTLFIGDNNFLGTPPPDPD
jgi:hypothetical protein